MNRSNENNITNSITNNSSVKIKEAFDALVSKLSVVQMREHVAERSLRTEFADIPDSMFGAYYIYSLIAHSGNEFDDVLMKAGEFVLGLFDGNERVWLEFDGWYLLADGYTSICTGAISNVPHTDYERTSVLDMFRLFSNAFRRANWHIPRFKDSNVSIDLFVAPLNTHISNSIKRVVNGTIFYFIVLGRLIVKSTSFPVWHPISPGELISKINSWYNR